MAYIKRCKDITVCEAYAQKLASAHNLKSFGTLSNAQIAKALGISEIEVDNA